MGKKKSAANIVFIGFMGVGKGRLARTLARSSDMFALDCDDLIESYTNMKIRKIFSQFGEPRFRELERQIALWLEKNVNSTIISTGGGFYQVPNLRKIGTIIHLHADFSNIVDSIFNHPNAKKKIKKRPLLNDLNIAANFFNERLPLYRKVANFSISVENRTMNDVAAEIGSRCSLKTANL